MMTCPECGVKEPFSTVKCECGHMFSLATRKKEERRLAHRQKAPELGTTAERYPGLRILAKVYRVSALLAVPIGGLRIVKDLSVLFSSSPTPLGEAAPSGWVVVLEALGTGLAFITCYAAAETIHLLFELNDRHAANRAE